MASFSRRASSCLSFCACLATRFQNEPPTTPKITRRMTIPTMNFTSISFFSTANPHFFHGFFFCPIIHYLVKIAMSSFDNSLPCFSQFFYNIIVKLCSGYSFFPHCDCSEHDFFHLPAAVFHGHNCHGHISPKAASAAASRVQPQPSVNFFCKILMTVSKNHHLGIP